MNIEDSISAISKELCLYLDANPQFKILVLVGRFCPIHIGHQILMGGIIKARPYGHTILIGSCNKDISIRNMFTYGDRRSFIKTLYPQSFVAPMPDFEDDATWFTALDDLIALGGMTPNHLKQENVLFVGGCQEDVEWYYQHKRNVYIVNRFGGKTMNVSGTEIRDHLISKNRDALRKLIDPLIMDYVQDVFNQRWNELRKK